MPTEKKKELVGKLEELLSRCTIAITTDYRGLSVPEMFRLRQRLRERGVEYRVVKNTLARLAAERAGKESLNQVIQGPTAIAFGYGDITEPAKALADFIRSSGIRLSITGAILDNQALSPEQVLTLSTLPPREVLMAQLLGGLQGPVLSLVNVLSAHLRGLMVVLKARMQQLEGS